MEHTQNYQLSQWSMEDRIRMEDFNGDNAKIDAALAGHAAALEKLGNCRVELLTYTGNGKYGEENPNTLTFSGKPIFVLIGGQQTTAFCFQGCTYCPMIMPSGAYGHASCVTATWSGNRLQYHCSNSTAQLNEPNRVYYVAAFYAEDAE